LEAVAKVLTRHTLSLKFRFAIERARTHKRSGSSYDVLVIEHSYGTLTTSIYQPAFGMLTLFTTSQTNDAAEYDEWWMQHVKGIPCSQKHVFIHKVLRTVHNSSPNQTELMLTYMQLPYHESVRQNFWSDSYTTYMFILKTIADGTSSNTSWCTSPMALAQQLVEANSGTISYSLFSKRACTTSNRERVMLQNTGELEDTQEASKQIEEHDGDIMAIVRKHPERPQVRFDDL
jgi:hypothetical protein